MARRESERWVGGWGVRGWGVRGWGVGRCPQYKIWIKVLDEKTKKLDEEVEGPCKQRSGEGQKERE